MGKIVGSTGYPFICEESTGVGYYPLWFWLGLPVTRLFVKRQQLSGYYPPVPVGS